MKKKILLITSFFESPYHKNRAPYNEQLFLELKSYFDIMIVRPIAWTDIKSSSNNLPKSEYYHSMWNNLPIIYPTYYFLPKIAIKTNGIMYYWSIKKAIEKLNFIPDILYTTWVYPDAYATMLLAEELHKKYFLRVHGSDINDLAFRSSIQNKIIKVLNNADTIISPSNALKEKMLNINIEASKIHVIYSGIDLSKFYFRDKQECESELNLASGKRRVLYIGNFKESKGVMDLLKATSYLRKDLKNLEIDFIGKGETLDSMKKFINENAMEEIVRIIGPIDHERLNPWINSADCVCLPSYSEGMPNVLIEALACKKNVVATEVGGIPELIKNKEWFLVKPGDPTQLAGVLKDVLTNNSRKAEPAIPIQSYKAISEQISGLINTSLNS